MAITKDIPIEQTGGKGNTIQSGNPTDAKESDILEALPSEVTPKNGGDKPTNGNEVPKGNEPSKLIQKQGGEKPKTTETNGKVLNEDYWRNLYDFTVESPYIDQRLSLDDFKAKYSTDKDRQKLLKGAVLDSYSHGYFPKNQHIPYPTNDEFFGNMWKEQEISNDNKVIDEVIGKDTTETVVPVDTLDVQEAPQIQEVQKNTTETTVPFDAIGVQEVRKDVTGTAVPVEILQGQEPKILQQTIKNPFYDEDAHISKHNKDMAHDPTLIFAGTKDIAVENAGREVENQREIAYQENQLEYLKKEYAVGNYMRPESFESANADDYPVGSDINKEAHEKWMNDIQSTIDRLKSKDADKESSPTEQVKANHLEQYYWLSTKYDEYLNGQMTLYNYQKYENDYRMQHPDLSLDDVVKIKSEREKYFDDLRMARDINNNPESILSVEGYQAARRLEEKAMENKTVSEINALTKSNQNEYGKQLADIKRKYDDMYSKEFSTYEKDITRKYSLLYQKAINADPTLTQLQKTYSDLYQSAQNDEDKQAILLEYNNKLTKSDAISKINKDYRYELDSRSVKLKQEIDEEYYNETEKLYKESAGKINDGIRNIVDNNYNRHINDDRNVISYVDAITKSDKFKGSDYATQKKFVELGWERFKSMVAKDLNSEYKRVPKKGEENKPYFFWTGKVKKTASELKADKASVRQRTGKMAERSFYLAAMDNMLYTKKGEPTVYQIKSMANFLLEKVKEERKRLKSDNTDLRTKIGQAEDVEIDDMGKPHVRQNPEYTGDRKTLAGAFNTVQRKLSQLNTAETFLNNIIEHPENEDFFIKEQWKGFTSGSWTGYIPFIHAAADILHLADLNDITKKVQAGKPLSRLEETIFKSWGALKHLETIKPKSRWYTIGETQKVMLPYVGEFLLTSGLLTAGTEAAETAMTAVIKRGIKKAVEKKMIASIGEEALGIGGGEVPEQAIVKAIEKKLENKGTQTLIKTFSKVVGAIAQSSGNPQMTMQNYYERITPQVSLMLTNEGDHITARIDEKGEDFGTAIYKSYFATLADLFTETLGGDIGKLAKGTIGKLVKNPEWLKRSVLGGWMKLRGFKTSASAYKYVVEHNLGWHGIFAEYSEEFVNGRLQAMITGDKSPFDINPSDELNTIISIAGFGAGMGTVNLTHSTLTSDGNVTLTVKPSKEKGEINIKVPKSTWGKFRKMALKKGIKPSIVNEMLRAEGLTEEQQDVLKSIYATIKAKGDTDVKIDWGDVDISEEEKQDIEDASDEVKKQVEDADFEGEEPIVEEQVTEEPKPAKKENVEQPTVEQPKEEATVEEQPVEEPKSAKKGRVKATEKEKEVEKAKETPKTKKEGKTKAKGKTEVKVEEKGKAKEKAKETPKVEQVKKEEPVGNVLDTKYEDVTIRETENGYDIYKGDEKLNARTYKTQRGVHNALSRLGDAGDISEKVSEKTKEVAKPKKKVKVAKPAKEKAKPIEKKETVSKKPIKEQIRDLENERDEKKKALKETKDISPQFAANEFGKIESEYNGKIDKLKARLETEKQTKKGKKVKKVGERAKKQIEVTKEAPVESKEEKATKSPEKQKGEKGKPKSKPKISYKTKIVDKSKKGKPIHEFVDADGKKRHIAYNKRKNVWEEVQYDKNVKGWRYPDKKIVGIKKNDIIDAINNKIEPSAKEAPVESKEEKATKSPKVEKGKSKSKPKISYKTKIVDKTENSDKVHEFTDADGKKRHILFNKKKRRWEEVEYNNKTKVWENPKKSSGGAGKKAVISAINWNKTKAFANVENDRQPKQKIESKWDKNTKLKDISTDDIEFESFSSHFGREHYFTLPDGTTIKIRKNPDATEIMSPIAWIVEEFSSDGEMKKEISRHPTLKEAKPAALKYADNLISEAKEPKPKTKKKTTKTEVEAEQEKPKVKGRKKKLTKTRKGGGAKIKITETKEKPKAETSIEVEEDVNEFNDSRDGNKFRKAVRKRYGKVGRDLVNKLKDEIGILSASETISGVVKKALNKGVKPADIAKSIDKVLGKGKATPVAKETKPTVEEEKPTQKKKKPKSKVRTKGRKTKTKAKVKPKGEKKIKKGEVIKMGGRKLKKVGETAKDEGREVKKEGEKTRKRKQIKLEFKEVEGARGREYTAAMPDGTIISIKKDPNLSRWVVKEHPPNGAIAKKIAMLTTLDGAKDAASEYVGKRSVETEKAQKKKTKEGMKPKSPIRNIVLTIGEKAKGVWYNYVAVRHREDGVKDEVSYDVKRKGRKDNYTYTIITNGETIAETDNVANIRPIIRGHAKTGIVPEVEAKSTKKARERAEKTKVRKRKHKEKTERRRAKEKLEEKGMKVGELGEEKTDEEILAEIEQERKDKKRMLPTSKNPIVNKVRVIMHRARTNLENTPNLRDATMVGDVTLGEYILDAKKKGDIDPNEAAMLLAEQKELINAWIALKKPTIQMKKGGKKEYDNEHPEPIGNEDDANEGNRGRIMPKKVFTNEKPQKLTDIARSILKGFKLIANLKDLRGRAKRRIVLGSYNRLSKYISLRFENDLNSLLHEISHFVDDALGITDNWNDEWDKELIPAFSKHGTQPTKADEKSGMDVAIKRTEAIAEYIRAWMINRDEAAYLAPKFTKHFEEMMKENPEMADQLLIAGHKIQVWHSASATQKTIADIHFAHETDAMNSSMGKAVQMFTGTYRYLMHPEFSLDGFWGRLNETMFDRMNGYNVGIRTAMDLNGVDPNEILEEDDPVLLARLFLGVNNKARSALQYGMFDANGNRIIDKKTKAPVTLKWLMATLDHTSKKALNEDIEMASALLVSQRVVELENKKIEKFLDEIADAMGLTETEVKIILKNFFDEDNGNLDLRNKMLSYGERQISGAGAGFVADYEIAISTLQELAKLKNGTAEQKEHYNNLMEAARRYRVMSEASMDYLAGKGRLSKEVVENVKKNNLHYVAMQRIRNMHLGYREFTEKERKRIERGQKRGVSGSFGRLFRLHTINGSARAIVDPYIALEEVVYRAIREADRNEVMLKVVDLLNTENKGFTIARELSTIGRQVKKPNERTITVFREDKEGKIQEEVWEFDKDVAVALKALNKSAVMLPQLITAPVKMMKTMITHAIPFGLRNAIRDSVNRFIISNYNSSFASYTWNKEYLRALEAGGADQSGFYFEDKVAYHQLMKQAKNDLLREGRSLFMNVLEKGTTLIPFTPRFNKMISNSEVLNRVAEYKRVYNVEKKKKLAEFLKDKSLTREEAEQKARYNAHLRAAFEARDLMDFAVMGTYMQYINQVVPFSNAAIQGTLRSLRALKKGRAGDTAAKFLVYSVLPTIAERAIGMAMGTEDERRQMPNYVQDMFWNFKVAPDLWLRIPKPFEWGMFSSFFGRAVDAGLGEKNAFEGYFPGFIRTIFPFTEADISSGLLMFYSTLRNYDSFRERNIVPYHQEQLYLEERDPKYASSVGRMIHKTGLMDARKFDFMAKSLFGTYGVWGIKLTNILAGNEHEKGFNMKDVGLFVNSPAVAGKNAQWVLEKVKGYGLGYNNRVLHGMTYWKNKYYEEKDSPATRDANAAKYREEVDKVRDIFEYNLEKYGNLDLLKTSPPPSRKPKRPSGKKKNVSKNVTR